VIGNCQLYYGENKLIFNEIMMRSSLLKARAKHKSNGIGHKSPPKYNYVQYVSKRVGLVQSGPHRYFIEN
jgi:hypothetical protein